MENGEFRVVIKHYVLKGKTPKETKECLDKHYGESAPSDYMVKYWMAEFKRGRTDTSDEPRSGRPIEVTTPENIQKFHRMVLNDRKLKLCEIAELMHMSKEHIANILHEYLHMKKLLARWVPRVLTSEQKENRFIVLSADLRCLSAIQPIFCLDP